MTRKKLEASLARAFLVLGLVIVTAAAARFGYALLGETTSTTYKVLFAAYEYLKDMSLLIVTGAAAYLTNAYQKRLSFIESLKEEWREVLRAKSAVLEFTHIETPTAQQYFSAFHTLSESIDNMRTVYRNVGESREHVGLFPFEPLHDMRRAFKTLNPKKFPSVSEARRKVVRDAVLQAFYSLRERFLEELDLEAPTRPILNPGSRRVKNSGAAGWAKRLDADQRRRQSKSTNGSSAADVLLQDVYKREQDKMNATGVSTGQRQASEKSSPESKSPQRWPFRAWRRY